MCAVSRQQKHQLCMRRLCEEARCYPNLYNLSIKQYKDSQMCNNSGKLFVSPQFRSGVPNCPVWLREKIRGWAMGLLQAAVTARPTNAGSSRAGPPGELCVPFPWFAWLPAGSEWPGETHRGGDWATRWPTHPCLWNNRLGNENCLLRQRGLLTPFVKEAWLGWDSRFQPVLNSPVQPKRSTGDAEAIRPSSFWNG